MPSALLSSAGRADAPGMPASTPAEVAARLVRVAEDLARLAADLVVTLHAAAAPVVQPVAPEPARGRTAWKPAEFAASLGVEYRAVLGWIHTGRVAAIKVGNQYRIPESERLRLEEEARDEAEQKRVAS